MCNMGARNITPQTQGLINARLLGWWDSVFQEGLYAPSCTEVIPLSPLHPICPSNWPTWSAYKLSYRSTEVNAVQKISTSGMVNRFITLYLQSYAVIW